MTQAIATFDDIAGNSVSDKPRSRSQFRMLLGGLVSAGLFGYLLWQVGWMQFADAAGTVPARALFLATASLTLSVFLAAWRLNILARYAGHKISMASALSAVCLGQLASLFLFQIFGQLLVRGAILKRSGVPAGTSIYLTLYERLTALVLLLAFASLGAFWIFGSIAIDFHSGGRDFIAIIIGGLFVLAFCAVLAWGRQFAVAWSCIEPGFLSRLALNACVTISIQLCTLVAFVALASSIAPTISLDRIAAASTIVMFAGSFPISMAGWGVRELGAVFALGAIGFPQSEALLIGIVIGVLSLITNLLVGLVSSLFLSRPSVAAVDVEQYGHPMQTLGMVVPVLAAMAIFFQIHIPLNGNPTNVNFADPMALLGGGLFLLLMLQGRPQWRLNRMHLFLAVMSGAILLGFFHGLYTVGWTQWATTRVFGWSVILAYGAAGALIVRTAQSDGSKVLARTIVSSAAAIMTFYLVGLFFKAVNFDPFNVPTRVAGFAVDPNAFAFQLLVAVALLLGCLSGWKWKGVMLSLLTIGIGLTGSRSGSIGFVTMIATYMIVRRKLELSTLLNILAGAIALMAIRLMLGALEGLQAQGVGSLAFVTANPGSTTEHFNTVMAGLQLFVKHPLFGNGLGYFMATFWKNSGQYAHPIDSTAVSLLAETGLAGFACFIVPFLMLISAEWQRARASQDTVGTSIVLLLVSFAAMGMFYDLLYQRLLWFVLGALIASETEKAGFAQFAKGDDAPSRIAPPMWHEPQVSEIESHVLAESIVPEISSPLSTPSHES